MAEGRLHSSDSNEIINDLPLGPCAVIVWIDKPIKKDAFLWRPAPAMIHVEEAVGRKVAWPESQVVVEMVNVSAPITPQTIVQTFMVLDFYALSCLLNYVFIMINRYILST